MVAKVFSRLALMVILVGWASPVQASDAYPFHNSFFVTINDTEIHFRHWQPAANADPARGHCLLLHGFSGSTFSWDGFADSLQQLGFEVVAPDIPPFGYSDKSPRTNQSITARATLIHDFLSAVYPGIRWHLTGHSMGGGIAQALALMYPASFHTVCFVAPTLFSAIRAHDDFDPALGTDARVRSGNMLSAWPLRRVTGKLAERFLLTQRRISTLLESAYGQPPDREQVKGYLQPLRIPGTAAAILTSGRHNREIATLDAADMAVPAIAIWGANDTWVPHASRSKALEKMPDVQVVIIEEAGHNPMETHLEAFMESWFILYE
jgi:2-hydroxy-6-oxonona-2,4-dienedioate hydrolase